MHLRSLALAACCTLLTTATTLQINAQSGGVKMDSAQPSAKPLASPAATAEVSLNGKQVTIKYNSPRLKGRTIGTTIVPYGQVWRTGANPATTLITATNLKIGTLDVPAGTYTVYTLPNASQWLLIVNKQTGQWGTEYSEAQDLGRTPMTSQTLPASQENMSISFEHTNGATTELHVKWATTDEYVTVKAQ
ncbi:DUF2911 domain-containing protein [Tunturiibacter gelidoferens]|uniref:DUF2911 domain-containing protein n=3 Tax=Tunturiibacter TaxID=3154218 RepID=A0A7Y9NQH5_9BACT|nr:DUF2911 domain-containing protein [Edaphobacter lichenicola]MBB5341291.1 hypothetical protein [Edaphobacter lichenicola]NYF53701.1 hypothetical protein [Edaphobacter lichenicola]